MIPGYQFWYSQRYLAEMNYKEQLEKLEAQMDAIRQLRNEEIKKRYTELYNISTWHHVKLGYVLQVISKEFELSTFRIRAIIAGK